MSIPSQSSHVCPIEHIFVLMLENNSFDRILGFVPGVGDLPNPSFKNQSETQAYVFQKGVPMVWARDSQGNLAYLPAEWPDSTNDVDPDLPHEFCCVQTQIFDGGSTPTNTGFVASFLAANSRGNPQFPLYAYDPDVPQLPALQTLARSFCTFTRWFSSVPGPTGPNRLFALCGTSGGYDGDDYVFASPGQVPMPSIFTSFPDPSRWNIYCDGNSQLKESTPSGHVFSWPGLGDIQGEGGAAYPATPLQTLLTQLEDSELDPSTLPSFAWLVPSYGVNGSLPGASFAPTSMHPNMGCPLAGDALVAVIYNALRASKAWSSSALLVVFDEHGGFADSVPPTQKVPAPDDATSRAGGWFEHLADPNFDFTSLGVRVPSILISPWVAATTDDTVYEHASIPRTLRDTFELNPGPGPSGYLTARDCAAGNFLAANLLPSARTDCPTSVPVVAPPLENA
ncbi:MAG: alkaline phosphatase family protein [Byssovorax sp.]